MNNLKSKLSRDWFSFVQCVDINSAYRNRDFVFQASVKVSNLPRKASAHLWVRIENNLQETVLFYDMIQEPILDSNWKEYSIKGKIPNSGSLFYFGVLCKYN